MMDFRIGEVLRLMAKTIPFLVFRFIVYFSITVVYMIAIAIGAGLGFLVGKVGDNPAAFSMWGGIIGFAAVTTAVYFLREYLLYLVKAGHIAVLVEIMDGKELPGGKGQIDYAQKMVRERFAQSSVLFGVDQMIKGILRSFNRMFFRVTSFLPIRGMQGVVKFVNNVVNLSLTYLDEVILGYNFRTRSTNPWKSSRTALILYAQNYKSFLKNAFFMALIIWGLTLAVFILVLILFLGLTAIFPGLKGVITVIIALVFAWGIKQALIEPIGMTALMQVFFNVTEGQEPNPEWESKLNSVSGKFAEFKRKAVDWDRQQQHTDAKTDTSDNESSFDNKDLESTDTGLVPPEFEQKQDESDRTPSE
jgi:hypothetical protein